MAARTPGVHSVQFEADPRNLLAPLFYQVEEVVESIPEAAIEEEAGGRCQAGEEDQAAQIEEMLRVPQAQVSARITYRRTIPPK